jgi:hypothetical protein
MIANEQKRQTFEANNLKVSNQNLDDHTGFAGAGQFNQWNDACASIAKEFSRTLKLPRLKAGEVSL